MIPRCARLLGALLLLATAFATSAGDTLPLGSTPGALPPPPGIASERKFLPVEQAYPLLVELSGQRILVSWNITPGYYLYRERMKFTLRRDGAGETVAVDLPAGEQHEDAYLGKTVIYRGLLEVGVPFDSAQSAVLEIKSQGCADAGLCYPPRTQWFEIDPGAMTVVSRAYTSNAHAPGVP